MSVQVNTFCNAEENGRPWPTTAQIVVLVITTLAVKA